MDRLRRGLAALLACAATLVSSTAFPAPDEYRVKAVFLFNFSQFVDWPDASLGDPGAPFLICVYGRDPFGARLDDAIRKESVHGHPLAVRRMRDPAAADACRMLFIGGSEAGHLDDVLQPLRDRAVLTVSDIAGSAEHGAIIQFSNDNSRLRLRINVSAAKAAGLTISSQLLRPAEIVGPAPGEPHG